MPYHLLLRNLLGHPVRTLLTLGSLVVAIFLLASLRAMVATVSAAVEEASSTRLIVQSAVSLYVDLPLAYQSKIEGVDGVQTACKLQWFGGVYQSEENFFAQFACDPDRLAELYPEIEVVAGSLEDFRRNRTACIVGEKLAKRYAFEVGQRIPILGKIYPRTDGGAWSFDLAAVYRSKTATVDENTLYFHFEYLDQAIERGDAGGDRGVGVYALRVAPDADPLAVMAAVDALFAQGPRRVQTTTEAEFQRQFVSMLGSVPTLLNSIGGGVLFAILLAVVNTMLLAARERTHDLGVMLALGFTDRTAFALLLGESLTLCLIGGLAGVGLAAGAAPAFADSQFAGLFPGYAIGSGTIAQSLGIALSIGLVAGVVPAWRASRLSPVAALRAD